MVIVPHNNTLEYKPSVYCSIYYAICSVYGAISFTKIIKCSIVLKFIRCTSTNKGRSPMFRLIVKLLVNSGILMLCNAYGILNLQANGQKLSGWNAFGLALFISLVFTLLLFLVLVAWVFSVVATLGVMVVALPFLGSVTLWLISYALPMFVQVEWFWPMFLVGFLLMVVVMIDSEMEYKQSPRKVTYRYR